jgi:phosphoglucomutase
MDYLKKVENWINSPLVTDAEKETIKNADEDTKKEMFGSDLHFGTAGMRALLGPGSARLNLLTVRRATIGVASFLVKKYGKEACKTRGFAISFDNRHYSKEFRDMAGKILTEFGFTVFTFHDPHPTPELSYTVRHLGCVGGLMITASHNPKEYNGYKVYDEEGCQAVYENIDGLIKEIDALPDELSCTYIPVADTGSVKYLDDDNSYDEEYVNKEISTSLYKDVFEGERLTKIVFTPECGCDCKVGPMALRGAGYEVSTVPGQDYFDPDFTNTPNPNPETEEAYLGAYKHIKELNEKGGKYNLIMATDPDADRMGIAFINKDGKLQRFTGNQTGALLIDYVLGTLQRRNLLPSNGCICNTFVTGAQGAKAASLYGTKVRTTATGFKYIGNMASRMPEEGDRYLFGYEESYGYLLADFIRDKDSLQSIIAIADMCEYYLRQGKTLDVALADLDKNTGHYYDTQVNIYFKGAGSLDRMNEEISAVRSNPFSTLAGKKVLTMSDYLNRKIIDFTNHSTKDMDLPDIDTTNCLRFDFEDESFLCIRPSGTEPKVKFYIEVVKEDEIAKVEAQKMADELKAIMHL